MPAPFKTVITPCILLGTLFLCSAAMAYEDIPKVNLAEVLPPELSHSLKHRVTEVEVRRGSYQFTVESDFGIYQIATLGMLRERVRELLTLENIISQYTAREDGQINPNRGQLQIRSDRALDILSRPVDTAGNLAGQLADNLGAALLGPEPEAARDYIYSGGESSDPVTALHKRNIASQWQLDVYSTNPKVQEILNTLAKARSGGSISAGTPILNRMPVKPLRIADATLDALLAAQIKSNGPAVLQANNERLLAGLHIDAEISRAFLQHPVLSPRHKTRIINYLNQLAGVANLQIFFAAANGSKEEVDALAFEQLAMMLTYCHHNGHRLRELIPNQAGGRPHMAVISEDGQLIYLVVQDLLYWNENTARRYEAIPSRAERTGIKSWRLITSGTLTGEARTQLRERGFEVEDQYLF